MTIDQRKEFVQRCPRKVYNYNELKQIVEIEKMNDCNLCTECYRYSESQKIEKAVTITEDDQKFYFTIESTGAIPPVQIIKRAFTILKTKINTFTATLATSAEGPACCSSRSTIIHPWGSRLALLRRVPSGRQRRMVLCAKAVEKGSRYGRRENHCNTQLSI